MSKRAARRKVADVEDATTVALRVAQLLRDDIVVGVLQGGERLNESLLADRYGVSRIPLREALRIVEGQGLIEIRPFSGAFVSSFSTDELIDVFEMHEVLESMALRLALPRLTAEDLRLAEQIARKAERESDPRRWLERIGEFYATLYAGVGRRHLLDTLTRLVTNQSRYLFAFFTAVRLYKPDIPGPRELVAVLRKRNLAETLKFQQAWRRAQRDFFVHHMSVSSNTRSSARNPSRRTSVKRRSR